MSNRSLYIVAFLLLSSVIAAGLHIQREHDARARLRPAPAVDPAVLVSADLADLATAQAQHRARFGRYATEIVPAGAPSTPDRLPFRGEPQAQFVVWPAGDGYAIWAFHLEVNAYCKIEVTPESQYPDPVCVTPAESSDSAES